MASSSTDSRPSIGILSIGDMGMGVAKLLLAHNYPVLTVSSGRSQNTTDRIRTTQIQDHPTDEALLTHADIILSIVPPRDALSTAKRLVDASRSAAQSRRSTRGPGNTNIIYIDLNAVSPRTISKIAAVLGQSTKEKPEPVQSPSLAKRLTRSLSIAAAESPSDEPPPPPPIAFKFIDGGIIGPPPSRDNSKSSDKDKDKAKSTPSTPSNTEATQSTSSPTKTPSTVPGWILPSIPLSGPHENLLPPSLLEILNATFISDKIGTASALKSCFASITKGLTAISLLSYTTASTCGVLPHLRSHLDTFAPHLRGPIEASLTAMPPKAYRWVDEMREIGETFSKSGA